jgi:hypothetical protein
MSWLYLAVIVFCGGTLWLAAPQIVWWTVVAAILTSF